MAKVAFSKLQININDKKTQLSYFNKNNEEVFYEVKYYLPVKEKLEVISKIINQSVDENGFYNPMRVKIYMVLETVYAYTNLSFTEKMKEDAFKLYDLIISTDLFIDILNNIRQEDWQEIQETTWETINNIYQYKNSAMGILENISSDYDGLNLDATEIQKKIADPENLELIRNILSKLG